MTNGIETGAGRSPHGDGSAPTRLARRLLGELQHRADLALFAETGPVRWTDALLAETRFHLAGALNAIEEAIRLEMPEGALQGREGLLDTPYCHLAVERHVELLSPELIDHLRVRAALSLILRGRREPLFAGTGGELAALGEKGAVGKAFAALTEVEQSWSGPPLHDAVFKPDLPAELHFDLAWSAGALLVSAVASGPEEPGGAAMRAIVHAVERVIAGHDEGASPFALAQRCARALSEEERRAVAPVTVNERRLLLFCALAEAETGLAIERLLGALIDGGDRARHALLRLMGVEEALAVQVHEMLAPLSGGSVDSHSAIVAFVEGYRGFDQASAEAWLEDMLLPRALSARLAIINS